MTPAMKPVEVVARSVDDVYLIRDDLALTYNPANALERMLITQMAQSWLRLQRAHAAEERYFQTHDLLDAIANDFERYKAITRLVTDCERAWRHAMLAIEKTQRRRKQAERTSPGLRRRPQPEPSPEPRPEPVLRSGAFSHPEAAPEPCAAIPSVSGSGTPACSRLSSRPPQPAELAARTA